MLNQSKLNRRIFISMNYNKIYDDLMLSRLLLKPERIKEKRNGEYFELAESYIEEFCKVINVESGASD